MKKAAILLGIAVFALGMSSCNMKTCVCYEPVGGVMTMNDTYVDPSVACSTLGSESIYNYRVCVEENERVDPSLIAYPYKKK